MDWAFLALVGGLFGWAVLAVVVIVADAAREWVCERHPLTVARVRYVGRIAVLRARHGVRDVRRTAREWWGIRRIRTGRRWGFLRAAGVLTWHCLPVWLTRHGFMTSGTVTVHGFRY